MCTRRLEESRKEMKFKFVFEIVLKTDCTTLFGSPFQRLDPATEKARSLACFFSTRNLKCNGQIRTETVFGFVDTRLKRAMKTLVS